MDQTELQIDLAQDVESTIDHGANLANDRIMLVSAVMPCLNEARTLRACIEKAHIGCQAAVGAMKARQVEQGMEPTEWQYEIIVADNGSTDNSVAIAKEQGARVVQVQKRGYGAALRAGIAAAVGKYVVMADADESYDFGEVARFVDKLEEGYDLVMGNRFAGGILPGAMPWHHRYIGNPVLSGIGRLFYRTPCRDWHCGLRGFNRQAILKLELKSTGMEFASEMLIACSKARLTIAEIPVTLSPDGRDRPPHLRSFRDGLRHLSMLVSLRL